MKYLMTVAAITLLVAPARAQDRGRAPATADERLATELVRVQLADTRKNDSLGVRAYVAHDRLLRASTAVRLAAAQQLAVALGDTSMRVRINALTALEGLGAESAPALSAVMAIVANPRDRLRMWGFHSFSRMRMRAAGRAGIPALKKAGRDSSEAVRNEAAQGLLSVGDTASAIEIYSESLHSAVDYHRLGAAEFLARSRNPLAVPVLQGLLTDTAFFRRVGAMHALGVEGPAAVAAVPALIEMLRDTSVSRAPFSGGESQASNAAGALAAILPNRGIGGSVPLRAFVDGSSNSLRSDGLGVYSWGVDSVFIVKVNTIALMLASDDSPRGPFGTSQRALRRSMSFDLSVPSPGSTAKPLGVVRDNEAQIHVFYRRGAPIGNVPVSDTAVVLDRVEMHFRINGELHILQMGPFAEAQDDQLWSSTALNGDGTSRAVLTHPSTGSWNVRAGPGSVARLWSLKDRAHAVDRGLYSFSFDVRFLAFPSGDFNCLRPEGDRPFCNP